MITIIGISGSLRKASFNSALLRAAVDMTPEGATLEVASIQGIPLYDGDVESSVGIPAVVSDLKDRIAVCDGLLLVTPEYNNSIPGVFKNAIDGSRDRHRTLPGCSTTVPLGSSGRHRVVAGPSWRRPPGYRC
jgi:NAD(P)H-dependent FMN reductase